MTNSAKKGLKPSPFPMRILSLLLDEEKREK
jgi:hypothetical protein